MLCVGLSKLLGQLQFGVSKVIRSFDLSRSSIVSEIFGYNLVSQRLAKVLLYQDH